MMGFPDESSVCFDEAEKKWVDNILWLISIAVNFSNRVYFIQ